MSETTEIKGGEVVTESEALQVLSEMIGEIIGEDYASEMTINMETSFAQDLELESIEFVALAEKLRDRFGESVDFVGWLANMELEQIIEITVGQVVNFVVGSMSKAE